MSASVNFDMVPSREEASSSIDEMKEIDLSGEAVCESTSLEIEKVTKKRRPVPYVYVVAGIAALNSANLGFDIGVMSGAAEFIQDDWNLTDTQLSILIGILNASAIFGAALAHYIIDVLGRRATFGISCIIFIFGVSGMALALNFAMILTFRIITGFGVGVGLSVDPVFISEVAPADIRGELVTWSEISINIGILIGFIASYGFKDMSTGIAWRLMLGCGVVAPIILLICVFTIMPESPRWLVARGHENEARQVLHKLTHPDEDRSMILQEIRQAVQKEEQSHLAGSWQQIFFPPTPGLRRALFVGIGIATAQQVLAEESLLFYFPEILDSMDVSRVHVFYALIAMGILKTLCIVVSASFLDSAGRRPMLLISIGGMGLALAGVAASFFFHLPWGTVTCIWAYMSFFSLGIGPGCWLLAAEVFPLAVRARAMALATTSNRIFSAVVASSFLPWANTVGFVTYFFCFAIMAAFVWILVFLYLPETKGKSLEAMAEYFETTAVNARTSSWRRTRTKKFFDAAEVPHPEGIPNKDLFVTNPLSGSQASAIRQSKSQAPHASSSTSPLPTEEKKEQHQADESTTGNLTSPERSV